MLESDAILKQIRVDRERLRVLGISEQREKTYYSSLSIECCDPGKDEEAFKAAVEGLNLSEGDQTFVRRVFDNGDGR
jgi:hypothetical protein